MNRADSHDRLWLAPPPAASGSCCAARTVLAEREAELLDALGPCRVSSCRLHLAHKGQHQIGAAR